jgi:hypothetical protein
LVLADTVKRIAILLCILGAIAAAAMYAGPRILRDPERTNPAEERDAPEDASLPPEFFSSDPSLLTQGPHSVVESIVDEATDAGVEGAPYFIEFADGGRYVFGHSDSFGRTKPLSVRSGVSHKVFWYDDALSKWNERVQDGSPPGAVQQGVAADALRAAVERRDR